jgi:hypothetical protein
MRVMRPTAIRWSRAVGVTPVAALATAAFVQMIARLDEPLISS